MSKEAEQYLRELAAEAGVPDPFVKTADEQEEAVHEKREDGAKIHVLEDKINSLEAIVQGHEQRIFESENVTIIKDEEGADGTVFEMGGPSEPYTPGAKDEIEPDCRVLDGKSGKREDKSIDWASGVTSVLRLYGWQSDPATEYTLGTTVTSGVEPEFLARVPDSKGATLKYYKLRAPECECCGCGTPCPPEITASGSGESVVFTIQNKTLSGNDCVNSGDPQTVTIPLNQFQLDCSGVKECIDCNHIRTTLGIVGMDAPPSVTASQTNGSYTVTIQPKKYKAGAGNACLDTENNGEAVTMEFNGQGGAIASQEITVIDASCGVTITSSGITFKTKVVRVLSVASGADFVISGYACESGNSNGGGGAS